MCRPIGVPAHNADESADASASAEGNHAARVRLLADAWRGRMNHSQQIRTLFAWSFALSLAVVACGGATDQPGGVDANVRLDDGGLPIVDGPIGGVDAAVLPDAETAPDAEPPPVPLCLPGCTTVADCVGTIELYSADNYICDGACQWQGCNTDSECQEAYLDPSSRCRTLPGYSLRYCLPGCNGPSDCATPNSSLYGIDNYACNAGVCEWQGCNSTSECQTDAGPNYVCQPWPGVPTPLCIQTCSVPGDCGAASEAFDGDNYDCRSNRCHYTGCNTNAECRSTYMDSTYVCQ